MKIEILIKYLLKYTPPQQGHCKLNLKPCFLRAYHIILHTYYIKDNIPRQGILTCNEFEGKHRVPCLCEITLK